MIMVVVSTVLAKLMLVQYFATMQQSSMDIVKRQKEDFR
jgi:hypothetical protein